MSREAGVARLLLALVVVGACAGADDVEGIDGGVDGGLDAPAAPPDGDDGRDGAEKDAPDGGGAGRGGAGGMSSIGGRGGPGPATGGFGGTGAPCANWLNTSGSSAPDSTVIRPGATPPAEPLDGGADAAIPPGTPESAEAFVAPLVDAYCARRGRCEQLAAYVVSTCRERYDMALRAQLESWRPHFERTAAALCLAALADRPCRTRLPASCVAIVRDPTRLPQPITCEDGCPPDHSCVQGCGVSGVYCAPNRHLDEACQARYIDGPPFGRLCAPDLYCKGGSLFSGAAGVCALPLDEGAPCSTAGSGVPTGCRRGLRCVSDICERDPAGGPPI